jgi:hypothetical protein
MKIITTTAEDFVKSEIDEWGFDYVDDMFAQGYEPTLINGVWLWGEKDVLRILSPINVSSNTCGTRLHSDRNSVPLI